MPTRNRIRQFRPVLPGHNQRKTPVLRKPSVIKRVGGTVLKAIKRTCMLLGALMIVSSITTLILLSQIQPADVMSLPQSMMLVYEFKGDLNERADESFLSLKSPRPTLREMVDGLDTAALDPRVEGFIAYVEAGGYSPSQIQEIRAAVKRFRASGKPAYIYATSYGGGGNALGLYYLASAFDKIYMQPLGVVSITGIAAEIPFFREALGKIGVEPEFLQQGQYKNAMESLMRDDISDASREMMLSILIDVWEQMLANIAEDRNMSEDDLRRLINKGLLLEDEAMEAGLVDDLIYSADFLNGLKEDYDGMRLVMFSRYLRSKPVAPALPGLKSARARAALVYIDGTIVESDLNDNVHMPAFAGQAIANAEKISAAIRSASKKDDIGVIILRVNSPGGSPAASETIRHAVLDAKSKGKKVIVSMGTAAASGGYWVSVNADEIIATPATLTGSIGVIGGKVNLQGLFEKLGVHIVGIEIGELAGLWSATKPFGSAGEARVEAMLNHIYNGFIDRVSEGRNIPREKVEELAQGRVWTGQQAFENGLVDRIGGLDVALERAAEISNVPSAHNLDIVVLPEPESPFEKLADLLNGQIQAGEMLSQIQPMIKTVPDEVWMSLSGAQQDMRVKAPYLPYQGE